MDQKRNYQKELEYFIREQQGGGTPELLLHSCCAPCSSYVLEYLAPFFSVTIFYFNPNIHPREEYEKRKAEQLRLLREFPSPNPVGYIDGDYDHDRFSAAVRGYEDCSEGGKRCEICFAQRLGETASKAKELQIPLFSSTLTVSPHKNAERINAIGESVAADCGVVWLPSDFKKKDGYKRSVTLAKRYQLYRQNYCGCEYSVLPAPLSLRD